MKIANIRKQETDTEEDVVQDVSISNGRIFGGKAHPIRHLDMSSMTGAVVTLGSADFEKDPKRQVVAEQFRLLRSRVKGLHRDLKLRTFLVTSALPGEGKTTVSANLAGTLSRVEGLRVLLVDFDLRHPSLHTIFGLEANKRSSSLEEEIPWRELIYKVGDNLDALFGFSQMEEPDTLLQGTRLESLLAEMKAAYDIVILDSAPMLAVADTNSLVPLVDCSLFVLNADTTPIAAAKEALSMLQGKVAGCIVNRVRQLKTEDYYRNSGYGYGYGSKRTEN